jgi:hypothetical protein
VILDIGRPPKFIAALKVRLPENHTETGKVTIAVFASTNVSFGTGLGARAPGANSTLRIIGAGICPA